MPGSLSSISAGGGDETWFKGKFYVAGADGCTQALDNSYGVYRMIDGVMDFGSRKSLFFYTDYCVTADLSEIWTVRDKAGSTCKARLLLFFCVDIIRMK